MKTAEQTVCDFTDAIITLAKVGDQGFEAVTRERAKKATAALLSVLGVKDPQVAARIIGIADARRDFGFRHVIRDFGQPPYVEEKSV